MNLSNAYHFGFCRKVAGRSFFVFLLAALAFLSGCAGVAQVKATGGAAADLLPMPGATVEVGTITVDAEKQFDCDCDPAGLLRTALTAVLKEEQLLWPGDNTPRFLFSAKIMDYEPGNAFKRWVLPGWGSTILAVRGEIQTSDGRSTAAAIENKRSIAAGGGYTIGAWRYVFESVASDLAREIKARINGGGFVVSLVPYSDQSSVAVHAGEPLEIDVSNISDLRTDRLRLGERTIPTPIVKTVMRPA